jgi:preprotein translocase subunit SecD
MNKYPGWLNALVLIFLLAGMLLALPNIYGSAPAVQLSATNGNDFTDERLQQILLTTRNAGIEPEAAYLHDGRIVMRFDSKEDQRDAEAQLRERYEREASIAITLAPKLPEWVRDLGLEPMSLGLDLRGGVYVLLEVDMNTAIETRMNTYQADFDDRLRDALIRHRVDLDGGIITVRLQDSADVEAARNIIRDADSDVLIADGTDGKSLLVRMTEQQIEARRNLAIEQNVTTLRNRVDELGVAEPLVQRQGADRIVLQLPAMDGSWCRMTGT